MDDLRRDLQTRGNQAVRSPCCTRAAHASVHPTEFLHHGFVSFATLLFHASTTTASARIIEMERPRSPLRISRHAHAPLSVTAHLKINPRTRNPVLRISGTDSSSRFERTFRRRYSLFHRERNGKSRIY